ncbi:MAG: DUF4377 domain-containing protein [Ferruginibacter sp.]
MAKSTNQDSLQIEYYKMPCTAEGNQWCFVLKVNEGQQQYYYGEIKGFSYEWGFHYTILAVKVQVKNAPSDAASFVYSLKKIIKKEKVSVTSTFELPLQLNDITLIKMQNGVYKIIGMPIIQNSYRGTAITKARSGIFSYKTGNRPGLILRELKP